MVYQPNISLAAYVSILIGAYGPCLFIFPRSSPFPVHEKSDNERYLRKMSEHELDTCETKEVEIPRDVQLRKRPWQYFGYPAFCDWSASDNDLFVLRRFKALNTRVLLRMQDSISQLEEELIEIDAENSQMGSSPVNNGSFRDEMVERREEILIEAGLKLKEYSKLCAIIL